MKRKIVCYFENESQCEKAVQSLIKAGIDGAALRIVSNSTQKAESNINAPYTRIGPAANIALPDGYSGSMITAETSYAQAPIATLLIRGDLFAFREDDAPLSADTHAVEVCANQEILDLARDILLNLF